MPTQNTEFCAHHQIIMVLRHFEELFPILREIISCQKEVTEAQTLELRCWYIRVK